MSGLIIATGGMQLVGRAIPPAAGFQGFCAIDAGQPAAQSQRYDAGERTTSVGDKFRTRTERR